MRVAGIQGRCAGLPVDKLSPIWAPSPNFGTRRDGLKPHLIVLHYTAMEDAQAAKARLSDPSAEVSAHYLIGKDGTCWQLVAEDKRAWHAGAGSWHGWQDINSRSIGIELDNDGQSAFSEPLMQTLETLLRGIIQRWSIPPAGVIGHSDMAPGRKSDPGPFFAWPRLEEAGLARPRGKIAISHPLDTAMFQAAAAKIGYSEPVDPAVLLAAVRLRYRPEASGPLCLADLIPLGAP